VLDRSTERIIRQNTSAPIQGNTWYNVAIWVEGSRIYVYLDGDLALTAEDLITPQLGAGQIILQTNNVFRPVRFDDFIIQRAEPFSDHFESAGLSSTWGTTSATNSGIGQESNGNHYVLMSNAVELKPVMSPVEDFSLRCRVWSEQGIINSVRESVGGYVLFDFEGGTAYHPLTAPEESLESHRVDNVYTQSVAGPKCDLRETDYSSSMTGAFGLTTRWRSSHLPGRCALLQEQRYPAYRRLPVHTVRSHSQCEAPLPANCRSGCCHSLSAGCGAI
jgi:hypothetical protein